MRHLSVWWAWLLLFSPLCQGYQLFGQGGFPALFVANQRNFGPLVSRLFGGSSTNNLDIPNIPDILGFRNFRTLRQSIEDLEEKIANLTRKCPSAARGAKIVGDFCYLLSAPGNYNGAKMRCFESGGRLAEPHYRDEKFVERLETAFPDDIDRASTGIIIGATSAQATVGEVPALGGFVFRYESNKIEIPARENVKPPSSVNQVAILKLPRDKDDPWTIEPDSFDQNHSYLCQYNII